MVRNAYQGLGGKYETLFVAFDKENEVFKNIVGKDKSGLPIWQEYGQEPCGGIHQVTLQTERYLHTGTYARFIKEFAVFLSNEAGLHYGSIRENCM